MTRPGRYLVPLIAAAILVYFLTQVHAVLLPFVLAAALAYLLNPLVVWFEIRGVRRRPAALLVFLFFAAILTAALCGGVSALAFETSRVARDVPELIRWTRDVWNPQGTLAQRFPGWRQALAIPWVAQWGTHGPAWVGSAIEKTPAAALHVIPFFEMALLVPFLTFFFMLDGLVLRDALFEWVPAAYVEMLLSLLVEIDNSLGNYLRGLFAQAVFLGIAAGVGFSLIGLHDAAQIALWVGATSMIPFVGAFSAALAGGIVALGQWGTPAGILKVLIVCGILRLVDDWLFHPLIFRRAVHIHPAVSIFSLMAGGSLFGFWGLLFAVPVVCMLKVLWDVLWRWYRSEYGFHTPAVLPEISRIPLI